MYPYSPPVSSRVQGRATLGLPILMLRRLSLSLALCLIWSLTLAPCLDAAEVHVNKSAVFVPAQQRSLWRKQSEKIAAMQAHLSKFPYRQYALARTRPQAALMSLHTNMPQNLSILDQSGRLARYVSAHEAGIWKRELALNPAKSQAALLHLRLGEMALAASQNPELADNQFRQTQLLSSQHSDLYGVASYDRALAAYYRDAYVEATEDFRVLLTPKTALQGYDRRQCALWLRAASASAGYHAQHAKIGIPEPIQLDPQCGAAALANASRTLDLPYDKQTILRACRVTGEGSSLQDIVNGAGKLGLKAYALTADDQGLMALPKPLVAHVERDHFVSVIRADKHGVSYLCSDCGMWPGGRVNLTWKQWHTMNAGNYAAICVRGGLWDQTIAAVLGVPQVRVSTAASSGVRVASVGLAGLLRSKQANTFLPGLARLRGHIVMGNLGYLLICGGQPVGPSPTASPAKPPTAGDPVNMATGEETYGTASPDLMVYNPVGPSVNWQRSYITLRGNGDGFAQGDKTYQCNDFGPGWTQCYNVGVADLSAGKTGMSNPKVLFLENGARLPFIASAAPTASNPVVHCAPGRLTTPYLLDWNYDGSATGHYTITFPNRTTWVTGGFISAISCYPLSRVVDRNGHAITFNYLSAPANYDWPLLSTITNESGTALLTIVRATDGSGNIVYVADCYGREVFYHDGTYANAQVPRPWARTLQLLDHVSQTVPTGTNTTPPNRYVYGYTNLSNSNPSATNPGVYELVPFLTSCSIPSPTGNGMSTVAWNYDPNTCYVTTETTGAGLITLANGQPGLQQVLRQHIFNYLSDGVHSSMTTKDSVGNTISSVMYGFDNNENVTTITNDGGQILTTSTYADPNDPYDPSSVVDANNNTVKYTWDQFGNRTSATSARGTKTAFTYDYSRFTLGELVKVQVGVNLTTPKTAYAIAYKEPSGLTQSISVPSPGTTGTGATVATSYTYDNYGNTLTVTAPGNNATSTVTATYNYTSDGSYSQNPAIGEPLTWTDNLGHITHYRYIENPSFFNQPINRGLRSSVTDPVGNETDYGYDIASYPQATVVPATNQSGSGRSSQTNSYLFPGGALLSSAIADESGAQIRQTSYTYDLAGNALSVSGSVEPVTYTYDGLYRVHTLTDGGGHTTTYSYNQNGYLATVIYPGAGGAITGPDTVNLSNYDVLGNVGTKVDGNNTITTYSYRDPENQLTNIHYNPGSGVSALADTSFSYDAYGRRLSMADATGMQSYAYDDNSNLLSDTTTYSGLSAEAVTYSYYPDGNRHIMTTPAGTFTYNYDAGQRISGITNPSSETTMWSYLANDWLQGQTLANGAAVAYSRDALGEVTDEKTTRTNTVLADFAVPTSGGYDGQSNLRSVTATGVSSGATNYSYDGRNQLVRETSNSGSGYTNINQYDSTTSGTSIGPGNTTSLRSAAPITFNANNQFLISGFSYDGNGNTVVNNANNLSYDPENRLTADGTAFTSGYTGDGLRAWKQGNNGRTYFIYDGQQPICELSNTGVATATNTYGPAGIVSRHSTNSVFYVFDLSGNVAARLTSSASIASTDLTDGFGSRQTTDTTKDPFGFSGQNGGYTDSETGLILLTHRYYSPSSGRFITRDPIGYDGGINLYAYTQNNPINGSDPYGTALFGIHWPTIPRPVINVPNPVKGGPVIQIPFPIWWPEKPPKSPPATPPAAPPAPSPPPASGGPTSGVPGGPGGPSGPSSPGGPGGPSAPGGPGGPSGPGGPGPTPTGPPPGTPPPGTYWEFFPGGPGWSAVPLPK